MGKKALIVATISGFITSFEQNDIAILQDLGYEVHIACNTQTDQVEHKLPKLMDRGVIVHHIPFARSPFSRKNLTAYWMLRTLLGEERFDLVHCHTPVGGVLGRMAAHRAHVPHIFYTAHGFHFFDGAPLRNWLIFYPIEKWLSRYTDVLITINTEDYKRASEKFAAGKIVYVPGIGVDTEKFASLHTDRDKIRAELGLSADDFLLLSVGELSARKNHSIAIEALQKLPDNVWYMIVGIGDLREKLCELDHTGRMKLLGYRQDIADLLCASDAFVFPSLQEGLPVALMEAMSAGLPCIASAIRGNVDLLDDGQGGFLFPSGDSERLETAIGQLLEMPEERRRAMGAANQEKIRQFDKTVVDKKMREIYGMEKCQNRA